MRSVRLAFDPHTLLGRDVGAAVFDRDIDVTRHGLERVPEILGRAHERRADARVDVLQRSVDDERMPVGEVDEFGRFLTAFPQQALAFFLRRSSGA